VKKIKRNIRCLDSVFKPVRVGGQRSGLYWLVPSVCSAVKYRSAVLASCSRVARSAVGTDSRYIAGVVVNLSGPNSAPPFCGSIVSTSEIWLPVTFSRTSNSARPEPSLITDSAPAWPPSGSVASSRKVTASAVFQIPLPA